MESYKKDRHGPEDTFDIELSTREIMGMRTVGHARALLREKGIEGV